MADDRWSPLFASALGLESPDSGTYDASSFDAQSPDADEPDDLAYEYTPMISNAANPKSTIDQHHEDLDALKEQEAKCLEELKILEDFWNLRKQATEDMLKDVRSQIEEKQAAI